MTRLVVAVAMSLAACGDPPPVANPSPFDEDDPAARGAASTGESLATSTDGASSGGEARPDLPTVEVTADDEPAVIERAALHAVLAAGPGAYAGEVMIEAVVEDGDLRGWRLTRWNVAWRGLAVGEVIVDINGQAIVRPDDLMELWESLWEVSEIAIRLRGDSGDEIRRFAVR